MKNPNTHNRLVVGSNPTEPTSNIAVSNSRKTNAITCRAAGLILR